MMLSMAVAATAMPMYAFAADEEPVVEAESEEGDSSEATEETEEESETESDSDFVEGSAVLADYDYKAGEMTDSGWANNILKMAFTRRMALRSMKRRMTNSMNTMSVMGKISR